MGSKRDCLVLLPAGFASSPAHTGDWWSLTPPFHLYPAAGGAVCSLLHFPYSQLWYQSIPDRQKSLLLGGAVSCGVRTFLPPLPFAKAHGTRSSHSAGLQGLIYMQFTLFWTGFRNYNGKRLQGSGRLVCQHYFQKRMTPQLSQVTILSMPLISTCCCGGIWLKQTPQEPRLMETTARPSRAALMRS